MSGPVNRHQTPFGLKDGRVVAPADVESGLICGCTCAGCGAQLVAKKGERNRWHFAHHVVVAGRSCVESAVHAAAKQILLEHLWLQVPAKAVGATAHTPSGKAVHKSHTLSPARAIRFDRCEEEVWEGGAGIRPDVVGYRGNRRLWIEIFVSHEVDAAKRTKIAEMGIPAVEIYLADLVDEAEMGAIQERVLDDIAHKQWLFYPGEAELRRALDNQVSAQALALGVKEAAVAAAQERKLKAKLAAKALQDRQTEEAHARYRSLPAPEKERQLRAQLDIAGPWPYHLNRPSAQAIAIDADPHLWQGALFARFVYGKSAARTVLSPSELANWVSQRFGVRNDRSKGATEAVAKYLGYLCACGFLSRPYNPYGERSYVVAYGGVLPPDRHEPRHSPHALQPIPIPGERAPTPTPADAQLCLWRASWPNLDVICRKAEVFLEGEADRDQLLAIVRTLDRTNCPATPAVFTNDLARLGVAPARTMELLSALGLVLSRKQLR